MVAVTHLQLMDLLPVAYFDDDTTGDLQNFIVNVLQPVLEDFYSDVERYQDEVDPATASADSLLAMLNDLGCPFPAAFQQSQERQRLIVDCLVSAYKVAGTVPGLINTVRLIMGLEIQEVITPAISAQWILNESALAGDPPPSWTTLPVDTDFPVLGNTAASAPYSFQVSVPATPILTPAQVETLTQIVKEYKPAHTHFEGIIQGAPPSDEFWVLGVGVLDVDTMLI